MLERKERPIGLKENSLDQIDQEPHLLDPIIDREEERIDIN